MKRKIIFFTPSRCGGAERVLVTISKYLSDKEFDVSYHLFGDKNQMELFIPKNRDIIWHHSKNHVSNFISIAHNVIKTKKPDVVFASQMPLNWRLVFASLGCKVKVILRSNNYVETQGLFQRIRLMFAYNFADLVIAQTEEMRQGIIKKLFVSSHKVITMANPVDKDYINNCIKKSYNPYPQSENIVYVAVGRFSPAKGFDILIKAFSAVKEKQPNAMLYIVGRYDDAAEYFRKIKALINSLRLNKAINLVGFKENPYSYMQYANCFVLSSRIEGLPNVMLEALYLKTPVAATTCIPVISRIVKNGKNGFLAKSEDPKSLASAMLSASCLGKVTSDYVETDGKKFVELFK